MLVSSVVRLARSNFSPPEHRHGKSIRAYDLFASALDDRYQLDCHAVNMAQLVTRRVVCLRTKFDGCGRINRELEITLSVGLCGWLWSHAFVAHRMMDRPLAALPLLAWRQVFSKLVGLLCTTITGACSARDCGSLVPPF